MKILVIQQKMIGDVLITSMLCKNLKKAFPNAQVDYLVNSFTIPVIENNPYIDNVIVFDDIYRKNYGSFLKFLFRIRRKNYDIVIDPFAKLESGLVTLFSGAKKRIGYKNKGLSIAYTHKYEHHKKPNSFYGLAIERRINLIKDLVQNISIDPYPELFLTQMEENEIKTVFKTNHIDLNVDKVIMVSVIGSEKSKTYPIDYLIELIDYICDHFNVKILFNYTPKQQSDALEIFKKCKLSSQEKIVFDLIGNNLRDFIAIMKNCQLIIGNDGGAINIAKALKKPTFTIFSPWIEKSSWSIFDDGTINKAVHLRDYKDELFKDMKRKEIKKVYESFYNEFFPSFFIDEMDAFLKYHLK